MNRNLPPDSPVSINPALQMRDLLLLKRMLLFTIEDEHYLHIAGDLLADHTEEILDNWYAQMQAHPYAGKQPDVAACIDTDNSLEQLRTQFRTWVQALCMPPARQAWLQRTHAVIAGDVPDKQLGDLTQIPAVFLRYLMLFIYPVTHGIASFLSRKGHTQGEVIKMEQAWFKAVSLSTLLWMWPGQPEP